MRSRSPSQLRSLQEQASIAISSAWSEIMSGFGRRKFAHAVARRNARWSLVVMDEERAMKTAGADQPQAVDNTRAGRGGGTHRRDLRRPKGPMV